ncbi:MAG: UbiX family flavin prenyltransferase [Aquificae bacterium]|nr:UbiX family flavin prenyltransferase [Aquificota bacterium]
MRFVLCVTGASGTPYAVRLFEVLKELGHELELVVSEHARLVHERELGRDLLKELKGARLHDEKNMASPLASGSTLIKYDAVFIVPCSTSTLAHLAHGTNANLIHRIGETALKERVPLVLLVREMPYSEVHLKNMLTLVRAGAAVLPASPAFYHGPKTLQDMIDFVVGKLLDAVRVEHHLYKRWSG